LTGNSKRILYRFIGDPTGYIVALNPHYLGLPKGWTTAEIGQTGREVKIDVDKAYLFVPEKSDGSFD
jgi:hypothetical protein